MNNGENSVGERIMTVNEARGRDDFNMTDFDRAWRESVDARLIALETVLYRHGKLLEQIIAVVDKSTVVKPKRSNQRKAVEYQEEFKQLWDLYPKRSGSNSKAKACQAWEKARESMRFIELAGHDRQVIDGLNRYYSWCKATDKIGTEYVMQAATFFGPGRHWESDWSLPEPKAEKVPSELNALVRYAAKSGLEAKVGEPLHEFRARVVREVAGSDE